jgi:hypothetical protein
VGLETTSDTGGGRDVGWINNGSWLEYTGVNFGSGLSAVTASPVPSGTHMLYVTFTSSQSASFVNVNGFTFSGG